METLINYLIYSAGILGVFSLTYHFLLRKLTFFHLNRCFLIAGLVLSICLPLIEIEQTVYIEREEVAASEIPFEYLLMLSQEGETLQPEPATVEENSWLDLLLYLYIAIAAGFLGKMLVELASLYKLISSGRKLKRDSHTHIKLPWDGKSKPVAPFSFFHYICYTPEAQTDAELQIILDHERVHVRQWHSLDLLLSHVYRAVFWVNPLAWILKKQIGENLEFIADCEASARTDAELSYERALLSSAAGHLQPALANNFFTPFIKKRILMLQQEASKKWHIYKYAFVLPVIILSLYSFNVVEKVEWIEKESAAVIENNSSQSEKSGSNIPSSDNKSAVVLDESKSDSQSVSDKDESAFAKAEKEKADQDLKILLVKITANMSREELDKKVEKLAEQNIELVITKAKYKNDRLVHLGFVIKDSKGYVSERNYKSDNGIDPICIKKEFEKGDTNWFIGSCEKMSLAIGDDKMHRFLSGLIKDDNSFLAKMKIGNGVVADSILLMERDELKKRSQELFESQLNMQKHLEIIRESGLDTIGSEKRKAIVKKHMALVEQELADQRRVTALMKNELEQFLSITNRVDSVFMSQPPRLIRQALDSIRMRFSQDKVDNQIDSVLSSTRQYTIDSDSIVYELKKGMKRINFDSLYRYGNLKLNLNDSLILAPYSGYDVEISDWAFHDSTLGNYAYPKEVEPLIIINGKKFKQLSFDDIKSKIISVNVLKGEEAIKVYGKDGKRGVVVVEVEEPVIIIESEGKQSLRVIKTFTNPTQEELEAFGEEVREQGYSFKIDRFKTRRGKLVKLKINFAGTDHTIATNTGIKKINFTFYKDGRDPEMTTVSY